MAIGDTVSPVSFDIDLGRFQVETVQHVSDLSIGTDTVEIKALTPTDHLLAKRPGQPAQRGEITITRGMDQSKAFTEWIKTTMANHDVDAAHQNITITVKDAKKKPVKRVHLLRAWASKYPGPALEAGANGPAAESVTITYEDAKIENA